MLLSRWHHGKPEAPQPAQNVFAITKNEERKTNNA
jgi:hypothetical protein